MAKKTLIGINNFHRQTKKKRRRLKKKYGPKEQRPKKYRGQGR